MGMYTSVRHPEGGRELQIKTGQDSCDWYDVGDEVAWSLGYYPGTGTLLDGVYDSYSDRGRDDWVVIKGHRVAAVEDKALVYGDLYEKHGIEEPDPGLWPEERHREYAEAKDKVDAEFIKFEKSIEHLPEMERLGALLAYPLKKRSMDYESIARKIFQAEETDS